MKLMRHNQEEKMDYEQCVIKSFSVIGKQGSSADGHDFIGKLWMEANQGIHEIEPLIKKENGVYLGVWGLMSDNSYSFLPWENNYQEGLYLAGYEVEDGANPPSGWVKWTVPSFEYIYIVVNGEYKDAFINGLKILEENN